MALRIESLCQRQFTIRPSMPITGQSFLISQREFGSGVCDALNPPDKRNAFWVYTQPCTIYSTLVVTWYQPRIIGCYECEPLCRGNMLRRYSKASYRGYAAARNLICRYLMLIRNKPASSCHKQTLRP